jgi:hypothetical protein
MPDWVWILIAFGFLYDMWRKIRVFDFARGLVHIEFSGEKEKRLPSAKSRKRLGK